MSLIDALNFRRSIRLYDADKNIDNDVIKECLEMATLAPNSSNMQLWEFYHVSSPDKIKELAYACFDQKGAQTAKHLVVFVTRQDLFRERAEANWHFEQRNIAQNSPENRKSARLKMSKKYYKLVMPLIYARFWGILGILRKTIILVCAPFTRVMYQVTESDMKAVVHKSCALAAQTFMLALAEKQIDSCPMEGYDSRLIKKALKLPWHCEINMVVSCGYRAAEGSLRGDRFRVPFEEVYHSI